MQIAPFVESLPKLALYVALLLLPGGSLGLLFLWWMNRRRGKHAARFAYACPEAVS
jgi:hypothetical protein